MNINFTVEDRHAFTSPYTYNRYLQMTTRGCRDGRVRLQRRRRRLGSSFGDEALKSHRLVSRGQMKTFAQFLGGCFRCSRALA